MAGAILGLGVASGLLLAASAVVWPQRIARRRVSTMRRLALTTGLPGLTVSRLAFASAGSAILAGTFALLISSVPTIAILAATVAAGLPVIALRRRAAIRRRAVRDAWPDAVDALVSAIRAGMSLPEAVACLAEFGPRPLRAACSLFAADFRASGLFGDALDGLAERLADPVADRVVAALRLAREVGGTEIGRLLRSLGASLREDARLRREIEGRQSWTVSAARLAVAAPWLTLAVLCTRPEAVQAYRSAAGAVLLLVAAAVSVLAYLLMVRIGRLPRETRFAR